MEKMKFKTNINCNNCKRTVSAFIGKEPAITNWEVDLDNPDKILSVEADKLSPADVVQLLQKAGFKAQVIE